MNKAHRYWYYYVIGVIWLVSGIINMMVSANYFFTKTTLGITYIGLAVTSLCLAIFYISMGSKKRKSDDGHGLNSKQGD